VPRAGGLPHRGLAKEDIATDLIFKKAGVLSLPRRGPLIQSRPPAFSPPNRSPRATASHHPPTPGGPAVTPPTSLVAAGCTPAPASRKMNKALLKEKLYRGIDRQPVDVLANRPGPAANRACMDA